jgi:hypothetical protein
VPIPMISPRDSEGSRHAVPMQVARVFRLNPPPHGRSEATLVFSSFS